MDKILIIIFIAIISVCIFNVAAAKTFYRPGYYVCFDKVKIYKIKYDPEKKRYRRISEGIRYTSCNIYRKQCDNYQLYRYGWYPYYSQARLGNYRCRHHDDN